MNPVPDNALSLTLSEPIGVAAQIIPWNYPLLMAAWKLAPAHRRRLHLRSQARRTDAAHRARTRELFRRSRAAAGRRQHHHRLWRRPPARRSSRIRTSTNRLHRQRAPSAKSSCKQAADTLKRVTLELGGKSPNIFFADADFEAAIDGALFGVFINQGEVCSAGSRILVEKSDLQEIRGGDDRESRRRSSSARRSSAKPRWVRWSAKNSTIASAAIRSSARKKRKSRPAADEPKDFAKGYYVEPTIFYDVDNSARIAREEIFGPVAAVIPFDDEATPSASPTTRPTVLPPPCGRATSSRRSAWSRSLRAGIVWVNHMQPTYVEAPWGGYKQSGFGRELGPWGIEEYLETKQVHINLNEQPIGWY